LYAASVAGAIFIAIGGVLAIAGGDWRAPRSLVVVGSAVMFVFIVYVVGAQRLLRDRRLVVDQFAGPPEMLPVAREAARWRWCLRHPLHDGDWWPKPRA
jgi:histidinol dehydrogenase